MKTKPMFYFIAAFSAISGLLYGYDIGVISGALLFMQQDLSLNAHEVSMIGAAVLGGGAFVTLITGVLSDWFGRKKMMLVAAIVFLLGIIAIVNAHNYHEALTARLIQGIGIGIITINAPLYIAESAPTRLRGRSVTLFQLMLTIGILSAGFVDLFFTSHGGDWKAMFLTGFIPGVIMLVGAFIIPESPRWLMLKGHPAEALKVLQRTRSNEEAEIELAEMQESVQAAQPHAHENSPIWQRRYILPLALICIISILQQLTAINSVLQFGALLLKQSGLHSNLTAMTGATGIMALNFLATFLALCLIDKVGRKVLLLIGTGGLACALFFSSAIMHFIAPGPIQGHFLMIGLFAFILFYAIGPGVVIWLILSELLPLRIRSKGMAVGLFLNCLTSAILAAVFIPMIDSIGASTVFLLCGVSTTLYFLISTRLPETNQKTLEEIEAEFV